MEINLEDMKKEEINEFIKMLERDKERYEKAYYLLMEYFDSISDEEKPKVSKELEKLGL